MLEAIARSAGRRQIEAAMTRPRHRADFNYLRDGAEIYRRSFATIRAEADLARFTPRRRACRGAHDPRLRHGRDRRRSRLFRAAPWRRRGARCGKARRSCAIPKCLRRASSRARLPRGNEVICTLDDPTVAVARGKARHHAQRRRARTLARQARWRGRRDRQCANRSCSIFSICSMKYPRAPACVIGMPVGFVGAAESKEALIADARVPFITIRGRKGGSAMAAAALNAIASEAE